jgi:hypothetical protein
VPGIELRPGAMAGSLDRMEVRVDPTERSAIAKISL